MPAETCIRFQRPKEIVVVEISQLAICGTNKWLLREKSHWTKRVNVELDSRNFAFAVVRGRDSLLS